MKVPIWVTATLLPISIFTMAEVTITISPASVTWVEPEDYRDIRTTTDSQQQFQEQVFRHLTEQFSDMAKVYLDSEQTLVVEVLDLDLAGDTRYSTSSGRKFRILTSVTPPAITFSYRVIQGEEVIKSDHVKLTDLYYQTSVSDIDRILVYEKQLIKDWARKELKR